MKTLKRTESDALGEMQIPANALYGIHAARAKGNFPDDTSFHPEWYRAMGLVKQSCYLTCIDFRTAVLKKYGTKDPPLKLIPREILEALTAAAADVASGKFREEFIVPAISGGAGTSINMNINEIIANAALIRLGKQPGNYNVIDPIAHANVFQSTNDVVPTALRVAVMFLLGSLEKQINALRAETERLETTHRNDLRIGYTQMQEAVPSSFGKLFSTYSDALSRDWWRVSKCFERIKTVNLGGGAIGTGIAVPRFFIMEAVTHLQKLTGLPVTRSENLADTTANLDAFVEVHAILKAHAVNLEKIVSDIRLLSSDAGHRELSIPDRQTGSSIMPGKVNPVIPEFVISAAHQIYANDALITSLCASGCLELNAYIPSIGHAMLSSLKLLTAMDETLRENLFKGLSVNTGYSRERLLRSAAITTALVPFIGYHNAALVASEMKRSGTTIIEANHELKLVDPEKLKEILEPGRLLQLGYQLGDLG
jgi:aspartate ammonia-lyase